MSPEVTARSRRPLLLVVVLAPTLVIGVLGGVIGWRLSAHADTGPRLIAAFVGVMAGLLALSVVLRPIRFAVSRSRRQPQPVKESPPTKANRFEYEDPGWSVGVLFRGLVPVWGVRALARETNGLRALRSVYSALVIAPFILLGVLAVLIGPSSATFPPAAVAIGVAIIGLQAWLSGRYWARQPLPAHSAAELLKRYRALFFLRFAVAESPILAGFVGFFLGGGQLWIYAVGLALGLIDLLAMAPTRGHIAQRQQELVEAGSSLSLGGLLALPVSESRALVESDADGTDG